MTALFLLVSIAQAAHPALPASIGIDAELADFGVQTQGETSISQLSGEVSLFGDAPDTHLPTLTFAWTTPWETEVGLAAGWWGLDQPYKMDNSRLGLFATHLLAGSKGSRIPFVGAGVGLFFGGYDAGEIELKTRGWQSNLRGGFRWDKGQLGWLGTYILLGYDHYTYESDILGREYGDLEESIVRVGLGIDLSFSLLRTMEYRSQDRE